MSRTITNPQTNIDYNALSQRVEQVVTALFETSLHMGVQQALIEAGLAPQSEEEMSVSRPPALKSEIVEFKPTPWPRRHRTQKVLERHGVKCPDYGTVMGSLWLLFAAAGADITVSEARELAKLHGHNPNSAGVALYDWRKFHGIGNPNQ